MKRYVALVLALSLPAYAVDGGCDAPIAISIAPDESRTVSGSDWVCIGKRIASCEGSNASFTESAATQAPGWLLPVLVVAGVLVGAGAGVGIAAATGHIK